jgi:hypothetical protein
MQINQFLPIFLLFCKSGLLQTVLLFFSSSVCSVGLLCINSFFHSSLLQLLFIIFYSSLSFISHCAYSPSHSTQSDIPFFYSFILFSYRTANLTLSVSFSFIHTHGGSTSHLLRQKEDNCLSN